jgi:hypothetical protein
MQQREIGIGCSRRRSSSCLREEEKEDEGVREREKREL